MQHYHYIFTGSGLSALMTVYEMLLSGKFNDKSILLIDENTKKQMIELGAFGMKTIYLMKLPQKNGIKPFLRMKNLIGF